AANTTVRSVKPPDAPPTGRRTMVAPYGLTLPDYDKFTTIDDIVRRVPMRVFPSEIRRLDKMFNGRVVGTTPEYTEVNQLTMAAGRFFTEEDDRYMENVCVLGSLTADVLFPFDEPVGQTVRLGTHFYKAIGAVNAPLPPR